MVRSVRVVIPLVLLLSCHLGLAQTPAVDVPSSKAPKLKKTVMAIETTGVQPTSSFEFKPFQLELAAGGGLMEGDVTYRIGSWVNEGGQLLELWFPLSELKWPLSVKIATLDARLGIQRFEARGQLAIQVTDDAGSMEDSDWEYIPDPSWKTTYSETDATLDYWQGDGSARYWMLSFGRAGERIHFAGGAGFLHQQFEWDAGPGYQWSENPYNYTGPLEGTVIHYEADVDMPYLEAAVRLQYRRLTAEGRAGYAPRVTVKDVDDHLLRFIRSETDASGTGWLADASLRYDLTHRFFIQAEGSLLTFQVDGTAHNVVYGGEDQGHTWEIYQDIESTQLRGTLALGVQL